MKKSNKKLEQIHVLEVELDELRDDLKHIRFIEGMTMNTIQQKESELHHLKNEFK